MNHFNKKQKIIAIILITIIGIGIYCYNDSAVGLCRLHKKGNKCSNYVCNDLDVGYEFL